MKKIIYIVTSITILIIAGVVFYFATFKKQFDPKPVIDEMAQTYYKEVIYPDNLRKYGEEYSEKMEELKEIKKSLFTIMEKVEHPDRYKFKKPDEFNIECDLFKTVITYEPTSPYNEDNFNYKIDSHCEIDS